MFEQHLNRVLNHIFQKHGTIVLLKTLQVLEQQEKFEVCSVIIKYIKRLEGRIGEKIPTRFNQKYFEQSLEVFKNHESVVSYRKNFDGYVNESVKIIDEFLSKQVQNP
jgi:hypothetical protein